MSTKTNDFTPIVSILMPVYNAEKYLQEAISSILNQTYKNFEFIIINDGSTDNSIEIINLNHDPRIKLHNNSKNLGLIKTLNIGLNLCVGKYIARMDADDISLPDRLLRQVEFLESNHEIVVLGTAYRTIETNPRTSNHPYNPQKVRDELLFTGCIIAHPTVMMRHDALLKYQLAYDSNYTHAEDYALWAKSSEFVQMSNLEEVHLLYRYHADQVSIKNSLAQEKCALRVRALLLTQLLPFGSRLNVLTFLEKVFTDEIIDKQMLRQVSTQFLVFINENQRKKIYSSHRFNLFILKLWKQQFVKTNNKNLICYLWLLTILRNRHVLLTIYFKLFKNKS